MPQERFSYIYEDIGTLSISRARRVLGSPANNLSDDQVRDLLHMLHLIAREQLCYNGSKINEDLPHEST